jgi:DNA-binding PadR family transcriptional regulator
VDHRCAREQEKGSYRYYILEVLRKRKKPMHYREITTEVLKHRNTRGKTPEMTILSILIKHKENFIRTGPGTYTLQKSSD